MVFLQDVNIMPSALWFHTKNHVLARIIRLNASTLFIFRLRNMNEVNAFIEENSALVDKDEVYEMYRMAINDAPYSSLYINTNAKDVYKMFYIRFEKLLEIENSLDDQYLKK